jgi:hypothetical protein
MMLDEKMKRTPPEVIALPPLKMVLVHAKEERENKAALQSAKKKVEMPEDQVNAQSLIKIIEHLEKKK